MSDNYIVSARKYRPQTFDTVVGQEHITTTLKNAIKHQHLAHAYLFCGPRGVGKTTCARILAKTINCENPTADMEACGVCPTCQSFKNNTSFNVFELDAASNNSVDDIRNLIDQVRFAPQQGRYKIYIIDEVHMLSAAAFNAFLKTLEEPPPYAIFILATTEKHKILPTILSRCQIFDFKRITTTDIVNHLHSIATKEGVIAPEAALHVIAQKSEGCMRDALSMLDRIVSFTNGMLTYSNTMEHLNLLDADYYFKLVDHMLSQDVSGTLLLLDQVLEKGFEGDVILNGLAEHMRNLLLCKDPRMAKMLDVPNEHKPIYHEKANQAPPSFILSALNVINESELQYKNATNKRLHVEMCLIRLCYLLQVTAAVDVKKKLSELAEESGVRSVGSGGVVVNNEAPKPAYKEPAPQPAPVKEPEPPKQQPVQQPTQPTPPIPQPQAPKPAQPQNSNNTGAPPPSAARRISKDLLADIGNDIGAGNADQRELTQELATEVLEKYRQHLRDQKRSVYHAQFMAMSVEALPPDEIRFITPNDLTDAYVKELRDVLIDFFRTHTGIGALRITSEIRIDPNTIQVKEKVLSKPEIYEAMAAKNPVLAQLKDALNLQIEY
ncbi:MAG: DNA polymerase III subunit gamma/tau [Bacteroidetes bacterium]|nr:DNA polymerase III subunit gamma/tau [Bacteroidota bacterium]